MKRFVTCLFWLVLLGACSDGEGPVPVGVVEVTPASESIIVGATRQLSASVKSAAGAVLTDRVITWSSSNTSVATVSAAGLVNALQVGQATITATAEGKTGSALITVAPVPVATVAVAPATATIAAGGTQQLTATVRDASGVVLTGRTVTWSSSSNAVATVNSSGLVTAVAGGTVTITAASEGRSGTANITVLPTLALSEITQGGAPANRDNLGGVIDVVYAVNLPAGHNVGRVTVSLGNSQVCVQVLTGSNAVSTQVRCTINTDLRNAVTGARLFPNGSYVLTGSLITNAASVLTQVNTTIRINNP